MPRRRGLGAPPPTAAEIAADCEGGDEGACPFEFAELADGGAGADTEDEPAVPTTASAAPSVPNTDKPAADDGKPAEPAMADARPMPPRSDGTQPPAAPPSDDGEQSVAEPQDPDAVLDADIEECFELRAHGKATPGDTSAYTLPTGETYTSFIFEAPWKTPVQGLRFRHLADNAPVVHHWILYTEAAPHLPGDIQPCDLSGVLGFLCGQGSTRSMVTGWAPGRPDFRLPEDVGLELPGPGSLLALEFHYFTSEPGVARDKSGVEVCVTSKFRPNTATITWLGTENIQLPANAEASASGTCHPQRSGMNAGDPIHILYSWPHMHRLGKHLRSVVNRADGSHETLYDGAFDFDAQTVHETPFELNMGDSITTTCTYQNTTPAAVRFGQSTAQEMCFNFAYAWPAHALDNPYGSFGEASNTCLH